MKLVYKRSTAATALAMPEETLVSEPEQLAPVRQEPAPAGALHRVYPPTGAKEPAPDKSDAYVPQRGAFGQRVRGGMPKGTAGRLVLACGLCVALATVALVAAGIRRFLLQDERFLLKSSSSIAIEGNEHLSRPEVLAVFGVDLERNIFKMPLAERRADLERLPWVEHATVMRLLPNHLRVQIKERTPVAFTRQGTQIGLVDGSGVLLDMPPEAAGDPHYSFPVLTGLAPDDTPEVRASRMEVYGRFMHELASAGPSATQQLSEVDVTNPEDVKALMTGGNADILVHFGEENFVSRYKAFERHLPEWRTQYPKLASVDMRYERQVVLEMQPGANAPLPAQTATAGATPAAPRRIAAAAPRPLPKHTVARTARLAAEHRAILSRLRLGRR